MFQALTDAIPGELLVAGGPALWVLLVMSVIALTIVLAKCMHFTVARLGRSRDTEAALADWQAGSAAKAVERLRASREPTAGPLATAMRGQMEGAPEELVREEVVRRAAALLASLRGGLRPLDLIAQLSPLLGLLGTVLGMITAFQQLASAGSQADPALLSGGIWEALLTTAAGLIIAIPAMTAHVWLEGRVERFRHRIEDAVTRVFTQAPKPVAAVEEPVERRAAEEPLTDYSRSRSDRSRLLGRRGDGSVAVATGPAPQHRQGPESAEPEGLRPERPR